MFFIFEMANNHMGDVSHGKRIIDEFSKLAKKYNINAGVKLQFRQLDTFIHKDFKNSDLKYVKRFNETVLTKNQFKELIDYTKKSGLKSVVTPFDNESIDILVELDVDAIKIASCSIDDWPLLNEVSDINKKIIISTAGIDLNLLREVYNLFKSKKRDFSFLHCVAEYPTPRGHANLERINFLKDGFSDVEIGFSTHEPPSEKSIVPYAVAMGCRIIEKHVAIPTENWGVNKYSCTPEQIENIFKDLQVLSLSTYGDPEDSKSDGKWGIKYGELEKKSLKSLKRGIYVNKTLESGHTITEDDLYYSMPLQDNQYDTSYFYDVVKSRVGENSIIKDSPLLENDVLTVSHDDMIEEIKSKCLGILSESNVNITKEDKVQLSAHYGLKNFLDVGCLIIDKINREYCKKYIIQLPNQKHPPHYHIKKEESFELLHGDCTLNLNGTDVHLELGKPILINRNVVHFFSSKNGCIVEEISTTHYLNDSKYEDTNINKLDLSERKININLESLGN